MNIRVFNRKRQEQAWTLAEVMVTVVVLAIIFVSLFAGFAYGFNTIRATREDLRATQILTQKIEGIRLCTWDQLNNQCPTNFQDTYVSMGVTNSGLIYKGTIAKTLNTDLPPGYRTNVMLVTVTVTWKTPGAGANAPAISHTRSMQTQSALYGLQNYLYGVTNSI
jgi:type II secretory pathway pseudopilin PulG